MAVCWVTACSSPEPTLAMPGRLPAWPPVGRPLLPPASPPQGARYPETARSAPPIRSAAAILIDYHTGTVLYEHNMHRRLHPASTTKILTALLALEHGRLDDVVEVSRRAAGVPGSRMGLRAGDRYTVKALLHGLMLSSGNDAATALAEHISGSEKDFALLMTERAHRLGLTNSTFRNAHGLTAVGHLTTAYDLAMLTRYALGLPEFQQLVRQRHVEVTDVRGRKVPLANTNQLLWNYDFAEGVKTGTTSAAGRTLVASASRGGRRLIAVLLRSPSRWYEAEQLLRWGFDTFETRPLAAAGAIVGRLPVTGGLRNDVLVKAAQALYVTAPKDMWPAIQRQLAVPPHVPTPVRRGQLVGTLRAVHQGDTLAAVPVVTVDPAVGRTLMGALTLRLLPLLDVIGPRRLAPGGVPTGSPAPSPAPGGP